jgi:DNA processing protein
MTTEHRPHRPATRDDPADRLARAALSRVVGPDAPHVLRQVRRHGAVAVWDRLRYDHPGVDPRRDLDLIHRAGGRLLCPGDDDWPTTLDALDQQADEHPDDNPGAPLALWVRSTTNLPTLLGQAITLVGTRASTAYGDHLAGHVGFALADRGWTVVSGGSFGTDAAAHRGALAAGGRTLAVLAGGVDVPFPAAHATLLGEITRNGALVSEAPPGSPPDRRRFLARSRLLAALPRGLVLVEAGYRAAALHTVRHARQLGRPVMAFPGPVTSATSAGCHWLLREYPQHTVLVTDIHDILEEVNPP